MPHRLFALSPLDGRYKDTMGHLPVFFSEAGLMQYRLRVEIEYLIALSDWKAFPFLKPFSRKLKDRLRRLHLDFGIKQAEKVKVLEDETKHDVKALEYYIRAELKSLSLFPDAALPFIHFGCTSEDINNLAYGLLVRDALRQEYFPRARSLITLLTRMAKAWKRVAMLAMTHGQGASPTTVGKELMVFVKRLERQLEQIMAVQIMGKFSGATGNWNAQLIAYPSADWMGFSRRFIRSLGLEPNLCTTQIEPHDWDAELFDGLRRFNTILLGLSRDLWLYISRGIFQLKIVPGEIGSSTMPHKVNPLQFENAEGNLELANALLMKMAEKLPISRMQRDLSDSTVQRSIGVAFGYSVLAIDSIMKGLGKLELNRKRLKHELETALEVLAEPIQIVMRLYGITNAYEQLKALTRGKSVTADLLSAFIDRLKIPTEAKERLKALKPEKYVGLAERIVQSS